MNEDLMLVECPACRHSVSQEARYCPCCGHPLTDGGTSDPAVRDTTFSETQAAAWYDSAGVQDFHNPAYNLHLQHYMRNLGRYDRWILAFGMNNLVITLLLAFIFPFLPLILGGLANSGARTQIGRDFGRRAMIFGLIGFLLALCGVQSVVLDLLNRTLGNGM